jgi:bacteriocin-like protein
MTNSKQVEREQTNQVSELTMNELECVSGGRKAASNAATGVSFLVFQFKLVAV